MVFGPHNDSLFLSYKFDFKVHETYSYPIFPSMKMSERTRVLNCSCLSFHCNVRLWPDTVKRVCTKKTKIVTSVMTIKGYTIYNLKRKQNSIGLIALSFWIIKGIFKSYVIMKTFRYLPTTTRFRAKHFIP